jgi:hypothetical protein
MSTSTLERVQTARLILERLDPEHGPELAPLLLDPRVGATLWPRAEPPSEPKQPVASKQSARPGPHAARPAANFGQPKPQSSIFGEDIISDKSLDEVILSYLAEDLEEKS